MYISDEIKAPEGWMQVTVSCDGVGEDMISELCADFMNAGLRVV